MVYHIFSSLEGFKFQVIQGFVLDGSGRAPCEYYSHLPHSLEHPALPKIWSASINPLDEIVVDSIHTDPVHFDKYRNVIPGRFDTIIVWVKDSDIGGSLNLKGMFLIFSPLI